MFTITAKQRQVQAAIVDYFTRYEEMPTGVHLAKKLGCTREYIRQVITNLCAKGFLKRSGGYGYADMQIVLNANGLPFKVPKRLRKES